MSFNTQYSLPLISRSNIYSTSFGKSNIIIKSHFVVTNLFIAPESLILDSYWL